MHHQRRIQRGPAVNGCNKLHPDEQAVAAESPK